ncbi:MAG: hypothetical protein ACTSU2_02755 [Promethearchaeota archaeon]
MKFLLYRMVFGDPEGAELFNFFRPIFIAMKDIDEDYKGPNFYWRFYQLGHLGEPRLSLVKWEVWSNWSEKDPYDPLKAGYIGVSCALFFYFADMEDTWKTIKSEIELFLSHQKRERPIFLAVALYDKTKNPKKELVQKDNVKRQMEFIKNKNGKVLFIPDNMLDKDIPKLFDGFVKLFLSQLDKKISKDFDLNTDFKPLTLEGVRKLLIADKLGITIQQLKLREMQAKRLKANEEYAAQQALEQELLKEQLKSSEQISEGGNAGADQTEAKSSELVGEGAESIEVSGIDITKIKDIKELPEEHRVAVSPEGKKVVIEQLDEDKLVDMSLKGYKFTEVMEAFIPRYCPKCGNHNQRMIFERIDRHKILLDYPRIYGLKTVCGNCGCEWDQNTRKILEYDD